jgi:hypothetical protein
MEEALDLTLRLWMIGVVWLGGTLGLALFYWVFGRGDRNEAPASTRRKDLGR